MTNPPEDLLALAKAAQTHAYAPYSDHPVGAAIRTPGGQTFSGCNVENAAYPLGTCAEAGAIAAMIAGGEKVIAEIVIVGPGDALCTPCGGCRQKISEFATASTKIHTANESGERQVFSIEDLLPHGFGPSNLEGAP